MLDVKYIKMILPIRYEDDDIPKFFPLKKEDVPKIKKHLKEDFPLLYNGLIEKYPEMELKEISNINRKALLKTIPNNTTFTYNNKKIIKLGDFITIEYNSNMLMNVNSIMNLEKRILDIEIEINDKDVVIIQNNEQWDEKTIFVN